MTGKPLVSIIISVHNQADYLPAAINSILDQTYSNSELICVNDGSTDNTAKILQKYSSRIRVVTNSKNQGLAHCLNLGLRIARGKYIARMDADDIADQKRIETQVKFMEQHRHIALCGTAATLIDQTGKKIGRRRYPQNPSSVIMHYNPIIHPSVMIRTKVIEELGDYDEILNGAEDYDLWLRINSKYQIINLPQTLLKYRLNPEGISWKTLKQIEIQALKARWKAITKYGYPLWHMIYLIKPAASFLIPSGLKKRWFGIS